MLMMCTFLSINIPKMKMILNIIDIFLLLISINTAEALYEGDDCTVPETNESGKCINVLKCEYAKKLLQSKKIPQHCGFSSSTPLVCCPPPPVGVRSRQKCNEYYDVNKQVYAAYLGTAALPKEFPHMAALGYGKKADIIWLCGGTLISRKFILTAAHCTTSRDFGPVRWVRLGDLDLKNTTEEANPIDVGIIRTIIHPNYKPPSHYHDIALIEMDKETTFEPFYKPACLYIDNKSQMNRLQATGWGKTGFTGDTSSILLKVDLKLIDHRKCAQRYSNVSPRKLPSGILDEFQICAGDVSGKDTCPGDSGGPLHFLERATSTLVQHYIIVGITSFGKGCGFADSAGVYTRVSAYIKWIEDIVWPSVF